MKLTKRTVANLAANVLAIAVLGAICALVSSSQTAKDLVQSSQQAAVAHERPILFDFDHYQKSFNKKYDSRLERAVRKCYYLARAIMAYLSGVAYKFWRSSSYLSINEFSDWKNEELAQTKNKVLMEGGDDRFKLNGGKHKQDDTVQENDFKIVEADFDPEQVAMELENEIDQTLKKVRFDGLQVDASNKRRKRDLGSLDEADDETNLRHVRPRDLSMDMLVQGSDPTEQPANAKAETERNLESNDRLPDRAPSDVRMLKSLVGQQVETKLWQFPKPEQPDRSYLTLVHDMKKTANDALTPYVLSGAHLLGYKPDEIYADLRQSGCLSEPKHQRKCGSCYAFSGIAIAEFIYCNATGKLVEFSEQYVVDCGKAYVKSAKGCKGAPEVTVATFINNFGLELAKNYPYVAKEQQCPYEENMDINKTGFIRMAIENALKVSVDEWPEFLKYGPIDVMVNTHFEFNMYGGGVYDGRGCAPIANHAMVVVGHGREYGQEYWLLRNSHGVKWGVKGYFKLAKSASKRCFEFYAGVVYGTNDGIKLELEPYSNEQYDPSHVEKMQALSAQQELAEKQAESDEQESPLDGNQAKPGSVKR